MPFIVRQDSGSGKWCVYTEDTGESHGCHPTREEAMSHLRALYANVPEASKGEAREEGGMAARDYVITFGQAVKALPEGKVGGYLVQFGSEATKDAEGEWFEPTTDFDVQFPARASIYYNHGLDPVVGRRRLAHGSMKLDDVGVWVEAQLDLSDRYQAAMYQMAQAGKLGWSSGSLSHITDPPREQPGGAIKSWPLGHDASLTPIPSDSRNVAIALKSWEPPPLSEMVSDPKLGSSGSLAEDTDRALDAAMVAQGRLDCVLPGYQKVAEKSARRLSAARWGRLNEIEQAWASGLERIRALIAETAPPGNETASPSPATGEGADAQVSKEAISVPIPGVDDLYSALIRQDESGMSLLWR